MMNPNEIKRQAESMSLVQARAIVAEGAVRRNYEATDADWETLIAAERVLGKWGELKYATYNED